MTSCGNKLLKLLLLGEAAVGKTALIRQFTSGNFQLVYKPTLGADFQGKAIEIDGESVQIQLWDFPGQERFRDSKSLYRHADGCILVYDATKPPTFDAIEKWRDEVVSELGEPDNFTFLLLGNKSDLPNKAVDPSAARDFASTSENMLFVDGRSDKLEDVVFNIPGDGTDNVEYMKNWTFTSSDGRVELDFEPLIDRYEPFDLKVFCMIPHQVFGYFSGKCITSDGEEIVLDRVLGFAEKVHNKW